MCLSQLSGRSLWRDLSVRRCCAERLTVNITMGRRGRDEHCCRLYLTSLLLLLPAPTLAVTFLPAFTPAFVAFLRVLYSVGHTLWVPFKHTTDVPLIILFPVVVLGSCDAGVEPGDARCAVCSGSRRWALLTCRWCWCLYLVLTRWVPTIWVGAHLPQNSSPELAGFPSSNLASAYPLP